MSHTTVSYLSPKLEARKNPAKGGMGVFAHERVKTGERLAVWSGEIHTEASMSALPPERVHRGVQVEEDLYLIPIGMGEEPADFFNHSCHPNAGLDGQIVLRAMRDIAPGEEVCFDYAMTDSSPYDEFECACGAPQCRHRITGNDWQNPELQRKYSGWFSPYLQRRINTHQRTIRDLRRETRRTRASGHAIRI